MTLLELVQRLWTESGSTGAQPTTAQGQTGDAGRLVTWVQSAYKDIIGRHTDWGWLQETLTFTTVNGQATYPLGTGAGTVGVLAADFKRWIPWSGRTWLTSVGTNSEQFLQQDNYWSWRNIWQFGANRSAYSRPYLVAVAPDKSLCLGPVPLSGYTVQMDYYRTATTDLTADADEPDIPEEFQEVIVWRALMLYGSYESAVESYDRGKNHFNEWMARLEAQYTPQVEFAGALA